VKEAIEAEARLSWRNKGLAVEEKAIS